MRKKNLIRTISITFLCLLVQTFFGAQIENPRAQSANFLAQNPAGAPALDAEYTPVSPLNFMYGGVSNRLSAFDFHIFCAQATLDAATPGSVAAEVLGCRAPFGAPLGSEPGWSYAAELSNPLTGVLSDAETLVTGSKTFWHAVDGRLALDTAQGKGQPQSEEASRRIFIQTPESKPFVSVTTELRALETLSELLAQQPDSPGVTLTPPSAAGQPFVLRAAAETSGVCFASVSAAALCSEGVPALFVDAPSNITVVVNLRWDAAPAALATASFDAALPENVLYNLCAPGGGPLTDTAWRGLAAKGIFRGTVLAPAAALQVGAIQGSVLAQQVWRVGEPSRPCRFAGFCNVLRVDITLQSAPSDAAIPLYCALFSDSTATAPVLGQSVRAVSLADGQSTTLFFEGVPLNTPLYVFATDEAGVPLSENAPYTASEQKEAILLSALEDYDAHGNAYSLPFAFGSTALSYATPANPRATVQLLRQDAETGLPLANAHCLLYRLSGGMREFYTSTGNFSSDSDAAAVFITAPDGSVSVPPQDPGIYYWLETIAPPGYSLAEAPCAVTVERSAEDPHTALAEPAVLVSRPLAASEPTT